MLYLLNVESIVNCSYLDLRHLNPFPDPFCGFRFQERHRAQNAALVLGSEDAIAKSKVEG